MIWDSAQVKLKKWNFIKYKMNQAHQNVAREKMFYYELMRYELKTDWTIFYYDMLYTKYHRLK